MQCRFLQMQFTKQLVLFLFINNRKIGSYFHRYMKYSPPGNIFNIVQIRVQKWTCLPLNLTQMLSIFIEDYRQENSFIVKYTVRQKTYTNQLNEICFLLSKYLVLHIQRLQDTFHRLYTLKHYLIIKLQCQIQSVNRYNRGKIDAPNHNSLSSFVLKLSYKEMVLK